MQFLTIGSLTIVIPKGHIQGSSPDFGKDNLIHCVYQSVDAIRGPRIYLVPLNIFSKEKVQII